MVRMCYYLTILKNRNLYIGVDSPQCCRHSSLRMLGVKVLCDDTVLTTLLTA